MDHHIVTMCGRVIQSSEPIRYAIVDGMNVRDNVARSRRCGVSLTCQQICYVLYLVM
jgi:hypothetical protein